MTMERKIEYIEGVTCFITAIGGLVLLFYIDEPTGRVISEGLRLFVKIASVGFAVGALVSAVGNYRLNLWLRPAFREKQIADDPEGRYSFYRKETVILLRMLGILIFIAAIVFSILCKADIL